MDQISREDDIAFEIPNGFCIYKEGRIDRFSGNEILPPFTDPQTGVQSKDVIISPEIGLSARIFLPRVTGPTRKLPLLVYFHGGAFCFHTPFSSLFHSHRRAPEHPLPIAFEDSWAAIQWILAHHGLGGPDAWLNNHADLGRVFVAGDSAGATLAHHVARRAGLDGLNGSRIVRLVAVHPYFHIDGVGPDKLLEIIFPSLDGVRDPRVNPESDPDLARLGCQRVLVCVAEKDIFKDRAWAYYEALKKSDWAGNLEIFESQGEEHVFHLFNPTCHNALALMNKVVSFFKAE